MKMSRWLSELAFWADTKEERTKKKISIGLLHAFFRPSLKLRRSWFLARQLQSLRLASSGDVHPSVHRGAVVQGQTGRRDVAAQRRRLFDADRRFRLQRPADGAADDDRARHHVGFDRRGLRHGQRMTGDVDGADHLARDGERL